MASTRPLVDDYPSGDDAARERYGAAAKLSGRRGPRPEHSARAARRARIGLEKQKNSLEAIHDGLPDWEGLKPVLLFLLVPIFLIIGIVITGGNWPKLLLYGMALLMGIWVAHSALRSGELVLACALFYLPFSGSYVIPLAPGVNGTNALLLLALFASVMRMLRTRESWFSWPPGASVVFCLAVISTASGVTSMLGPAGYTNLLYTEMHSFKAWIDQFLFYFIALSCIRDKDMAKRMVLYMCIGSMVLVIYAVPEMLDKMGRSTIEKSRIEGPHRQSNNFGGFVAYTLLPVIAMFMAFIKDIRAWLFTPYFLVAAKVLITTFSRGAYVALALGGLIAAYLKGRSFLMLWAGAVLGVVVVFPQVIPTAITARLDSITADKVGSADPESLDKSSSNRLILWRAAAVMIMEDPLTGKGFKEFPRLKEQYTEQYVKESDPHNMYLYIGSQMGLPALVLFIVVLGYAFFLGRVLSQHRDDRFIRAIGIGGASATVCYSVICMFGSRAVNLEFTSYFWMYLAILQVLYRETKSENEINEGVHKRGSAFDFESSPAIDPNKSVGGSVMADGRPRQIRSRTGRRFAGLFSGSVREPGRMRGAAALMAADKAASEASAGRRPDPEGAEPRPDPPQPDVADNRDLPVLPSAISKRRRRQKRRR